MNSRNLRQFQLHEPYLAPGQEKYFSGGFTTKRHGSMCGGNVDAIQLETPRVRKTAENEYQGQKWKDAS